MLQIMINKERYFSLDYLNTQLENFELGYMEVRNRPSLISAKKFSSNGKTLKQIGMYIYIVHKKHVSSDQFTCSVSDESTWTHIAFIDWISCS